MTHLSKIKLNPALRSFLKPLFGKPRRKLTLSDWTDFKARYGPGCLRINRRQRKIIKHRLGKWPEQFSFDEFLDYYKPNSGAPNYLDELWLQLSPTEREVVKNLNEWAFTFPASFATQRQYRAACAFRLERFFNRKFHPTKARSLKIERDDAEFSKIVEASVFDDKPASSK